MGEVGRGIEQRAVEIDDDGFDRQGEFHFVRDQDSGVRIQGTCGLRPRFDSRARSTKPASP
jgi:hypothetical protein